VRKFWTFFAPPGMLYIYYVIVHIETTYRNLNIYETVQGQKHE